MQPGASWNSIVGCFWDGGVNWRTLMPVACNGRFKNMRFLVSVAPGAGTGHTFSLEVNNVAPANGFSCSIMDTATTGEDIVHEVRVKTGDWVNIKCTPTGIPVAPSAFFSLEFYPDDPCRSILANNYEYGITTNTTRYGPIYGSTSSFYDDNFVLGNLIANKGRIRNLYVKLKYAPASGNQIDFTIMKNDVATAITCSISGEATTGSDLVNEITVVPGDKLGLREVNTKCSDIGSIGYGCLFISDRENFFPLPGGTDQNVSSQMKGCWCMINRYSSNWTWLSNIPENRAWRLTTPGARYDNLCVRKLYSVGANAWETYTISYNNADTNQTAYISANTQSNARSTKRAFMVTEPYKAITMHYDCASGITQSSYALWGVRGYLGIRSTLRLKLGEGGYTRKGGMPPKV
jgi:hypothetical protein